MEKSSDPHYYYAILGLCSDSSAEDVRRSYRNLAMKWHPDKWVKSPSLSAEAKRKFQQIQEAYAVLSNPGKRKMYDIGFYDPDEEEDEGFVDFLQEMTSLIDKTRTEDKHYSMEELQSMFWDMAQSFEFSECSSSFEDTEFPSLFEIQNVSSSMQQQPCGFSSQAQPLEYKFSQWSSEQSPPGNTKRSLKRTRSDTNHVSEKCSRPQLSDLSQCCTCTDQF